MKSNCCDAPMTVGGEGTGEGDTHFWVCESCLGTYQPIGEGSCPLQRVSFDPPIQVRSDQELIIEGNKETVRPVTGGWKGTSFDSNDHWEYQGTTEVYNSFWKTIISSPQWQAWAKQNREALCWDTTECEECGWISEEHFQEFIEYIIGEFLRDEIKKINT